MIDKYVLQEKLKTLVADYLKEENIILVDLNFQSRGRKSILRILVDEPEGGISLDRCAYLNNEISELLDREDLIETRYTLEVSSPGIDRPLRTREDFSRCLNRKVKIFFNQSQGQGQIYEISGVITFVTDAGINLDLEGQIQQIPFDQIKKAKQIIE